MPTSSNMIGHIYITELVYKQKLYVWYSCCYELRVITLVAENGASTTHKLAELFFPRKLRRLVGTLRDLCGRERVAGDTMALKLPTLLEGEALVAWLAIPGKTRGDYCATKQALKNALKPTEFSAFAEFQSRKLRPGETVHMYAHHLKRLLDAAMPELDDDSKSKILFQQFVAGVPDECSRMLRANPDIITIDAAVNRAKLLLTIAVEKPTSSVAAITMSCPEVRALQNSVKYLTEQMSALMGKLQDHTSAAVQSPAPATAPVRCYNCNRTGHLSRNCRQPRRQTVCYNCNQPGHVARNCQHQGNGLGTTTSRATGRPNRI